MKTMMIHNDDSISTRLFAKWVSERYDFSLDKVTKIQEETFKYLLEDKCLAKKLRLRGGRYHNSIVYNDEAMAILTQEQISEEE